MHKRLVLRRGAAGLSLVFALAVSVACLQKEVDAPVATEPASSEASRWRVSVAAGASPLRQDQPFADQGYRDGPAQSAELDRPVGAAFGLDGSLYIADSGNRLIRRLTPQGDLETVAGSGQPGTADGPALTAEFRTPVDVSFGPDGVLYIVDAEASQIRALTPGGQVLTVAGFDQGQCEPSKVDGKEQPTPAACPRAQPYRDGPPDQALFFQPSSVAVDSNGTLYVADAGNNCIRIIGKDGTVSLYVGTREAGFKDGPLGAAQIFNPVDLAFGPDGVLYFTDQTNRLRQIRDGAVTTVAGGPGEDGRGGYADGPGTQALFRSPTGIAIGIDGSVIVADTQNQRIRRIDLAGDVTTVAGRGGQGLAVGRGSDAQFSLPVGVAVSKTGDIYVADYNLGRVFKLSPEDLK